MDLTNFFVERTPSTVVVGTGALTYVFAREGRALGPCVRVEVDYAFGFFFERSRTPVPSQVVSYDRRSCPLKLTRLATARVVAKEAAEG